MSKSYVTLLVCPWCKKEKGTLALDRQLRDRFDMHTPDSSPCDECMKEAVLLYDRDTKKFLAYVKKEAVLNKEGIKKFKGTPVKSLGKINPDGSISFGE